MVSRLLLKKDLPRGTDDHINLMFYTGIVDKSIFRDPLHFLGEGGDIRQGQ
jgi:hypothetical protein